MTVYTTKTQLAYSIERDYFQCIFAYVAREADPACPPQDPTSSPENIYLAYCRIAHAAETELTAHDLMTIINHKQKLQEAAETSHRAGKIDDETLKKIKSRVGKASQQAMHPLLLRAEVDLARLKPGETKPHPYMDNWERVIDDLRPDEVRIVKEDCD